jgi:hypothetical protein
VTPSGHRGPTGHLRDRLMALAGTPDDCSEIGTDLIVVTQVAASLIARIDHVSVTRGYGGFYATVAGSSELAVAVDRAQYHDGAGPCLDFAALDAGSLDLVAGLAGATARRTMIQRAVGLIVSAGETRGHRAYLALRAKAAEAGASLADTAARLIEQTAS